MTRFAKIPSHIRLIHHEAIGSTNAEAMRLAGLGDPGGVWIATDDQTEGKGRSGRSWQSVPGNLYASCLLRLDCSVLVAQQLSLVAGVAVIDAIADAAGAEAPPGLRLKWPNDILIETAKMGGILVETTLNAGRPGLAAVIGVGLNLAGAPDGIGRTVTSLRAYGVDIAPRPMLCALACSLDRWMTIWDEGRRFTDIRSAWCQRGGREGEAISVNTRAGTMSGCFAGIDVDGALLLKSDDGRVQRFSYGDVSLSRADAGDVD